MTVGPWACLIPNDGRTKSASLERIVASEFLLAPPIAPLGNILPAKKSLDK